MDYKSLVFGAAVGTLIVAGSVVVYAYSGETPPLKGVPLMYDSQNKLMGPFVGSAVVLSIRGNFVNAYATYDGFQNSGLFYHTTNDCSGARYFNVGYGLTATIYNGSLFYPGVNPSQMTILSTYNTTTGICSPAGFTSNVAPPAVIKLSTLGFSPPFYLKPPLNQ